MDADALLQQVEDHKEQLGQELEALEQRLDELNVYISKTMDVSEKTKRQIEFRELQQKREDLWKRLEDVNRSHQDAEHHWAQEIWEAITSELETMKEDVKELHEKAAKAMSFIRK